MAAEMENLKKQILLVQDFMRIPGLPAFNIQIGRLI